MAEPGPLDAWAAAHAADVLAEAQEEALAEARRILRDQLTRALVRAAQAPRSEPPAPAPAAQAPAQDLVWVYGVVPAGADAPAVPGIGGHGVRSIRNGPVAALVSTVPAAEYSGAALNERLEDLGVVEAIGRAHDGVLEAALAQGDVVPFRMCTLYESDDAVSGMLAEGELNLAGILERLAGKEEWGVKAFLEPVPVAASAGVSDAASGTEYLARRRAERDDAEQQRDSIEESVAGVHARLAERASAAVLSRPHDKRLSGRDAEMVLNGAYLVPRDGAAAFAALVDRLRADHAPDGLALELTGPWPPYHFVAEPS